MKRQLLAGLALIATLAHAGPYEARERDWRNGAVVYQIIVDRFVPAAQLDAKRALYPAPKRLRDWSEDPTTGPYLEAERLAAHELDFWGGDLPSATTRLGHVQQLGADVLYINPIHRAYTNHKYDALDFQAISPEYGTRDDFKRLAAEAHRRGLKVVLDGVFNHMGRNAPAFQSALRDPKSPWRDWFAIGPQYTGGARVWTGFQNLPELNLETPAVRRYLYEAPDSVVRSYLRDGADGWRLDTAFELGRTYLADLTRAAHREKPGSLVVGEIVNYPGDWLKSLDAVMNFTLRQVINGAAGGEIDGPTAGRMIERMVADAGIEPMLKSWVVIDNHDIPRIATQWPDAARRRLVQALQFTLPGAPNLYYGVEVGMEGGADPANRGPMRWERVSDTHPEMTWVRHLVALHKGHRALRVGDFRRIESAKLLAFERHTDRALDTRIILANPSNQPVRDRVMVANWALMDDTPLHDLLGLTPTEPLTLSAGFITVELPAHGVLVLEPRRRDLGGYDRYKRVR
ncbi:alpha-amylase family glycosyl hydrolase [Roseateles sp. BYS87W]|uniref:Alpha-amylase family glycosyl hydrolase n=1 Tax=Pelomonas baiyunensis TaxID=3299026 RepID=A0ABW7GYK8_9BURK